MLRTGLLIIYLNLFVLLLDSKSLSILFHTLTLTELFSSTEISGPPLSEAADWFDHYDMDKDNTLTLKEIVHALYVSYNAVTPDKQKAIRELVSSTWEKFDKDKSKTISRDEFLSSKGMAVMYDRFFQKIFPDDNNEDVVWDDNAIDVKIYVPNGQSVGDLVRIPSPRTGKPVLLLIPEINKWKTGSLGAYFVVKF